MFWFRNKKNNFLVRTLIWRLNNILKLMYEKDVYFMIGEAMNEIYGICSKISNTSCLSKKQSAQALFVIQTSIL